MIDFAGECIYVTAGRRGVIQAWHLDGQPASPRLNIDGTFAPAFCFHATGQQLLAAVATRNGEDHQVSVWDLLRGKELTAAGRFDIERYTDKTIDHLSVVEDDGRTIIVGALGHSAYHAISAWDLNSAPAEARSQRLRKLGLRSGPRDSVWDITISRPIKCIGAVRYGGASAIAVGDEDGWVTVLRASDGEQLRGYRAHDKQVVGVSGDTLGGHDVLISAGLDGGIVVAGSSAGRGPPDPGIHMTIDVGDRIRTMAAVPGGRVVVGTEEGFLLFQLAALRSP
jgi:WD40 repeat protein